MQDSEARIDLLRQRAGLGKGSSRRDQEVSEGPQALAVAGPSTLTTASGHINLFEDLEQVCFSTRGIYPIVANNAIVAIFTHSNPNVH